MEKIWDFLNKAREKGYHFNTGSVFKMDVSSSGYNLSFWLRSTELPNGIILPSICEKRKYQNLNQAIDSLLEISEEIINRPKVYKENNR